MKATVYYLKTGFFRNAMFVEAGNLDPQNYEQVTVINDAVDREDVWRRMNVVDRSDFEIPLKLKCRSMSVGDVVVLEGLGAFLCASCGWDKLPDGKAEELDHLPVPAKFTAVK